MVSPNVKRRRTTGPASGEEQEDKWSSMLGDVMQIIAGKIGSVDDYVRFSAVCRSWHSHAADYAAKHKLHFGPLFMSGTNPNSYLSGLDPDSKRLTFRNPNSGANFTIDLPETAGSHCWGSPFGWLITFNNASLRFSLLNPFTGATVPLPGLPRDGARVRYKDTMKAFLTADPVSDPDNCLVVLVSGLAKLSFFRPAGDRKSWSKIYGDCYLLDIAHSKGNLYGIESSKLSTELFMFQLDHVQDGVVHPLVVPILDLTPHLEDHDPRITSENHLVDLNGELCMCVRYFRRSDSTTNVEIFKIDLVEGSLRRVLSLGDHCLFLGNNHSFSYKMTRHMTKLFGQSRHGDYVFYTDYHMPWRGPSRRWRKDSVTMNYIYRPPDLEVWDMVQSRNVHSIKDKSPTYYGPLWIFPSIN